MFETHGKPSWWYAAASTIHNKFYENKEQQMSKFKVGDRVRALDVIGAKDVTEDGGIYEVTGVNTLHKGCRWNLELDGHIYTDCDNRVELLTKSLDNLAVDDVVVTDMGTEYTVAAVNGRVIGLENSDGHFHDTRTIKELKDNDWTVKGAEEELTELTLEDVAKLAKVDVSKLRIRE